MLRTQLALIPGKRMGRTEQRPFTPIIAQRYMPAFHAVFRNSGFVIGTLLMRLALSASPLWSPAIGLFAALFVLAVTWGTNYFTPLRHQGYCVREVESTD